MLKFLAMRIHDGFLRLEDVPEKARTQVAEIYKSLYGNSINF